METKDTSHVTISKREVGQDDVLLIRNEEEHLIAHHDARVPWSQLMRATEVAVPALQDDFAEHLLLMPPGVSVAFEPFKMTVSLWRKEKIQIKRSFEVMPLHDVNFVDSMGALLSRLPKLAWQLKKSHTKGKCEMFMVDVMWLQSVDSALASKVVEMIDRKNNNADAQRSALLVDKLGKVLVR